MGRRRRCSEPARLLQRPANYFVVLALVNFGIGVVGSGSAALWIGMLRSSFAALFLLSVFVLLFSRLLRVRSYSAALVPVALAAYAVLTFAYAHVFNLVLGALGPGSFRGLSEGGGGQFSELLYFSFTTITTLGYGDIVPVANGARVLATSEAFFGQLFVAVILARLVGLQLARG
jgi:hypothetical protein